MVLGFTYPRLGVSTPFDPTNRLVTSPWFSPTVVGWIRLALALYALFTAIFILIWEGVVTGGASSYFSYFTDLSYIGLLFHLFFLSYHTLRFAHHERKWYPLQRWGRGWKAAQMILGSTVMTYPLLVTIVFWGLLASPSTLDGAYSGWSNISHHALNTVFALFEILFTNVPAMPWLHLPFMILLLGGYLGVAYITKATQGFYTYSFLDPSKEHAKLAAYIIGIALAEIILFTIIRYIIVLRVYLVRRYTRRGREEGSGDEGLNGVEEGRGGGGGREGIEDWEEVERPSDGAGMGVGKVV